MNKNEMYRTINTNTANVIILAGMPASGKTTISSKLSETFGYPILEKDVIKEELFDTIGFDNHDEKQQIDVAATAILLRSMDSLLQSGTSLICVNNFRTADKPQLMRLLEKHNCRCVTVFLGGDSDVFYKRYVERDRTHSRHLGHATHDHYPPRKGEKPDETPLTREQFAEKYESQGMADFRIDGPRIDVDATYPERIDIQKLIAAIRENLY